MPVNCEDVQLIGGTHLLQLDISGNTGQVTSYNVAYQAPGTTPPVAVPRSIVSLTNS